MYSIDKTEIVAAIQKYGAYKYTCIVADQSINQLFQIAFHYWIIYVQLHMQIIMHDHIIIWTFKWLKSWIDLLVPSIVGNSYAMRAQLLYN